MKSVIMFLFMSVMAMLFTVSTAHSFQAYNGTTNLGLMNIIKCSTGVTCSKVGDKLQFVAAGGAPATMVLASATTITAAQCGYTFYNSGAVEIELPEASTVIGCKYTFVTLNAANFDVDPDAADQILVQTNAAGDMIRNATLGNNITLMAVSASQWVPVGILGTWTDAN